MKCYSSSFCRLYFYFEYYGNMSMWLGPTLELQLGLVYYSIIASSAISNSLLSEIVELPVTSWGINYLGCNQVQDSWSCFL